MPVMTPKNEQLKEWSEALGAMLERMYTLTHGLSREQFNFKPAPDRWSVGQCIEHLTVSMRIYLDLMEPVIAKAGRQGDAPYGRGLLLGRVLIRALRKPDWRYPAPRSFQPRRGDLEPSTVRDDFERQVSRMQQAIARCDGLALGRITMPWPVLRLVKISLAQAFELQILHTGRHLMQAERVTRADDFPD